MTYMDTVIARLWEVRSQLACRPNDVDLWRQILFIRRVLARVLIQRGSRISRSETQNT